ncbi:nitroreductase family protein [Myroides sp. 1354]|uniref:nitroreductase family protein n=1 Tax=unclassified Myroides TaxID=2642485 RepID=UPI002578D878|nr:MULTISPECIES: nitroreductase family protein [unclassified Myroides]MDM1044866.1 nitroreductase family protein [Myroides sp. R163-1]MDM1055579.1 nitroreductase family protein [Myroides sp. 1354]MDM1068876.1 nitroreductase family protein [Myroides sp. 1372]
MSLIENLNWRHAVKAYDSNKKVSEEQLNKIIEAARLAPTSSGLQPFKLLVVKDQAIKEKLAEGALNPECMRDCSHVLIFAAWDKYTAERIDSVYDFTTDQRELPRGRFDSYTTKLKEIYLNQPSEMNFAHAARQTYIALGLALAQAAELRVDSTPAEGFSNEVVDRVLNLQQYGLKSVSLMYIGYADAENDWIAPMKKVRVPKEEFVLEF